MKLTPEDAGVEVDPRVLELAQAAIEAAADPNHQCNEAWESATGPAPNGDIEITSHCDCGRIVRVIRDTVLPRGHQHWH